MIVLDQVAHLLRGARHDVPVDWEAQQRQMRATITDLESLVGGVVIACGQIEFMFMTAAAYAMHPSDGAQREQRITQLYRQHGPEVAASCRDAIQASLVPHDSLREKFVAICDWYKDTYEERNRLVHDAWVFQLEGDDYRLARVVTKKGNTASSRPVLAELAELQALANDLAQAQLAVNGYTSRLRETAEKN